MNMVYAHKTGHSTEMRSYFTMESKVVNVENYDGLVNLINSEQCYDSPCSHTGVISLL